jgi:SAM-dependent methyltransferase
MDSKESPADSLGLYFISFAGLVLEITLTRIFSVTLWYHFAFLVLSVAMLGNAAAGALIAGRRRLLDGDVRRTAAMSALFFAGLCLAILVLIRFVSLDLYELGQAGGSFARLSLYYLILVLPFLAAGLCVSLCLCRWREQAGRLYAVNLLGAGSGCLAVVFLIPAFSNAGSVVLAAVAALAAAWCFGREHAGLRWSALVLAAGLTPIWLNAPAWFPFKIADSKSMSVCLYKLGLRPLITRWNAFSQIDVIQGEDAPHKHLSYVPGLSPKIPLSAVPEQKLLFIDADATTPITHFVSGGKNLGFLQYVPSTIAYQLRPKSKVCVIGAGGGYDVLAALNVGQAASVDAVEINPDIADIVRNRFREFSGGLYDDPRVRLHIEDGRSFIRNTDQTFDLLQISLVDTWAAASSGGYSLTENYLYTVDAFSDYMKHLSGTGVLTVSRWLLEPPNEILRLVSLSAAALERGGVAHPERRIALIAGGGVAVMLLKMADFTPDEVWHLGEVCKARGFGLLYAPGFPQSNVFSDFLLDPNRPSLAASYPYDISPPTDDKPFYFDSFTWRNAGDKRNVSFLVLWGALLQALVLSALLIFGPLVWAPKMAPRGAFRFVAGYFGALGMAFMLTEVALIQELILFLGKPVYALSVVLFSLLIFSGLGSLWSQRFGARLRGALQACLVVLPATIILYSWIIPRLSYLFFGHAPSARAALAAVFLAPIGALMGMPFSLGLRLQRGPDQGWAAWAWAVNGCASVIGSIAAVMIAMSLGFSAVLQVAAAFYLFALLLVVKPAA